MIRCHLSKLLGERRMKLSDLQRATGLSYTGLHNVYHEKTGRIDYDTLSALCSALEVQPGDLLSYVPDDQAARPAKKKSRK